MSWLTDPEGLARCIACCICFPCAPDHAGLLLRHSPCCAALPLLVCVIFLDEMTSAICLVMPDKAVVGRLVLESNNKAALQRLVSMEERWAYAYSLRKLLVSPFQVRHRHSCWAVACTHARWQ